MKGPDLHCDFALSPMRRDPMVIMACALMLSCTVSLMTVPDAHAEKLPANVQRQVRSGQYYFRKGYIKRAIPAFKRAVKAAPNSETANLWLAKALIKQGGENNYTQAQEHLAKVLETNPDQAEAMMMLGEILGWNPTSRDQAIDLLKRSLTLREEYPAVKKQEAKTTRTLVENLNWAGRYREAATYAQDIRQTFAEDPKWQATYANLLSHVGQTQEAIDLYETLILPMETDEYQWQLDYIYALTKGGRTDDATDLFQQVKPDIIETGEQNLINTASALAYGLGLYDASVELDTYLPETLQETRDTRMRHGRALKMLGRHPEAIESLYAVYQSQAMSGSEKVEFADYMRSLAMPSAALPEPNLIESLYRQGTQETSDPGAVYLKLARFYAADEKNPNAFLAAADSFEQAVNQLNGPQQKVAAKKEFMDTIKARPGQTTDAIFRRLIKNYPNDYEYHGHYAEYLSWQKPRRKEAIEHYLDLSLKDARNRKTWVHRMEEVMGWHTPNLAWLPLYEKILSHYPKSRATLLAKARALAGDPDAYPEALEAYQVLKNDYPDDPEITREWVGLLTADESRQKEALTILEGLIEQYPDDLSTRIAYGKLLSYRTRYRKALIMFDSVLAEAPDNREALIGKGYTLLWSGKKFKAKALLTNLFNEYPNDPEVALALAAVHKSIGRNDKAMDLLRQIQYQMQELNYHSPDLFNPWQTGDAFIPCAYPGEASSYSQDNLTFDFSVLPSASSQQTEPSTAIEKTPSQPLFTPYSTPHYAVHPSQLPIRTRAKQTGPPSELDRLEARLNALNQALGSLNEVQTQSGRQLKRLKSHMWHVKHDGTPTVSAIHMGRTTSPSSELPSVYGQLFQTDVDNDALLSGQGGHIDRQFSLLEGELFSDMRPEYKIGYGFQFQEGEPTTNELFSWDIPNQIALYMTPQLRVRAGVTPRRFYLPNSPLDPRSNLGVQYTVGATAQYWDRVRLDADLGITHFTQSSKENITYRAQARIHLTDEISMRIGARRNTLANSLLAVAGIKPAHGAFAGRSLGPANENAFYLEFNTNPYHNIDLNLGYEWAVITGTDDMPNNFKNQFFTSVGYTHRFNPKHSLRAAYEFLYFNFSKNATNGFFDVEANVSSPLAVLRPVARADSGYDFGGYFSPDRFFLNAFRLDYRGSLFDKFLEYKIGGSLGVQAFEHGFGIQDSDPTSMASAFNIALKMNFTDWVSAYGRTNFMDSGGIFSRWRFEGGLIFRPNIQRLTPVFGDKPAKPDRATVDRNTFKDADFDSQDYKFYN